jgi:hypothetical protein
MRCRCTSGLKVLHRVERGLGCMMTVLLLLVMGKGRHHCNQRAEAAGGEEHEFVCGRRRAGGRLRIAGGDHEGLAIRRLYDEMQFVLLSELADHFQGVTGKRVMRCGDVNRLVVTLIY